MPGIVGGQPFHPPHPGDRVLACVNREVEPREFRVRGVAPGVLDQLRRLAPAAAADQQPGMAQRRGQEVGVETACAPGEVDRRLGLSGLAGGP